MKLFSIFKRKEKQINYLDDIKIIRSSQRKKTISLRIKNGAAEVLCPLGVKDSFLKSFVMTKNKWIQKKIKSQIKELDTLKSLNTNYLLFKGKKIKILNLSSSNKIFIKKNSIVMPKKKSSKNKERIKEYLKKKAEAYLKVRVKTISSILKIYPTKLEIKSSKRIWGCCINQKVINLNWKLIMLPPEIISYIIVHELSHIIEPNHSKKFWDLVRKSDSQFEKKKEWLKINGAHIIQF